MSMQVICILHGIKKKKKSYLPIMCINRKQKKFFNLVSSQSFHFLSEPMMLVSTIRLFHWILSL